MTANNSTSKRLAMIVLGSLFLWACSDTPKPTVSGSGETQEKALASEGGDSTDTLHASDMGTGGMAEMHAAMPQDTLCAEGAMAGAQLDLIHAIDLGNHGEALMAEMHTAMAQDSLHLGGAMMMGTDPGGAMALPSNGTGIVSPETPPASQAESPTSTVQGDAHGH